MFFDNELQFLCEVYRKNRIGTAILRQAELLDALVNSAAPGSTERRVIVEELLRNIQPRTVYRILDTFSLSYRLLLLPNTHPATVFYVGPFLSAPLSPEKILEEGERHGIPPAKQRHLAEFYSSIPVLPEDAPLYSMFNTFCERIWKSHTFTIRDVAETQSPLDEPISQSMRNMEPEDSLVAIKTLERRYAFENEMIRAVNLGQLHMEARFRTAFSAHSFEKRHSDPLRNAKNYGIIMNTLLRKAAEQGGVHPVHLDRISSDFAAKIEQLPALSASAALMSEMFRTYCRTVQQNSVRHFSPLVQNTILMIHADLSSDLSPGALARAQSVSLGYLSTVFRRETQKTVSEYIRQKRMEYAAYLLSTTQLQIQSVALHCGIMDVQYFSKLFKKCYGRTPTEYRQAGAGEPSASVTP